MDNIQAQIEATTQHMINATKEAENLTRFSQAVQDAIKNQDGIAMVKNFIASARSARKIADELSQYADGVMDMFGA